MNKRQAALGSARLSPQKKHLQSTTGTSQTVRPQPSTSSFSSLPKKPQVIITKFRQTAPKLEAQSNNFGSRKSGVASNVMSDNLNISGKHPASEDVVLDDSKKFKKGNLTPSPHSMANDGSAEVEDDSLFSACVGEGMYDEELMMGNSVDSDGSFESDQPNFDENELSDYLSFKSKSSNSDKSNQRDSQTTSTAKPARTNGTATPHASATPRTPHFKAVYSNLPKTHSPDYTYVNKQTKNVVEHKTTPKSNTKNIDKTSEVLVPANINQYGECLKTRLGRYHYGLTLNDPPCLFFRGVLKGSSGQTLAVLFGDTNLLSTLEALPISDIGNFVIDNTFSVIPKSTAGVNRVLTINLLYQNQTIPLWYAVTSCSSMELYKRIIIEFQQHVLDWPFTSVLVNDDPALCLAIKAVFPDADLHGSWYHYCYGIWKEMIMNNLAEECKTNVTLLTAVKMLMVVPYLPPPSDHWSSEITMPEGLEVVRQFAEEHSLPQEFNNVLQYVADFWFEAVQCNNFTVFGEQVSSLNLVEVFQLSLISFMKPDGNIWTLTRSFQNVAKVASFEVARHFSGKPFSTRRKFNAKKFNVPIRNNMKKLLAQNISVKSFLELSTIYCDEVLDIFLHPLYPTTASESSKWVHMEGWKIWTIGKEKAAEYSG